MVTINRDARELWCATSDLRDYLDESTIHTITSNVILHIDDTLDDIRYRRENLQALEKKANSSNSNLPLNWVLSIKQAYSFTEEFVTICQRIKSTAINPTTGIHSEHIDDYFDLLSRVSIFYGVSTKFPSEERINEILCQKCQHDDQSNDSISDSATSNDTNINEITPTETIKTEQLKQDQIKPPESKLVPAGGEANLIKVANENDVDPVNSSEVISPKIGMKQSNSQLTLSIVFSDILVKYWFFNMFCCSKFFSMLNHQSISSTYVVNARPHFTMASFLFRNSRNILNYSINYNSNSYLMDLQCYQFSSLSNSSQET